MKKVLVLLSATAFHLGPGSEDPVLVKMIHDLASRSSPGSLSMILFGCSLVGIASFCRRKYYK
jgi:hypothetical protein